MSERKPPHRRRGSTVIFGQGDAPDAPQGIVGGNTTYRLMGQEVCPPGYTLYCPSWMSDKEALGDGESIEPSEHTWRAKYDPAKGKLFFVSLRDKSIKDWKLPDAGSGLVVSSQNKQRRGSAATGSSRRTSTMGQSPVVASPQHLHPTRGHSGSTTHQPPMFRDTSAAFGADTDSFVDRGSAVSSKSARTDAETKNYSMSSSSASQQQKLRSHIARLEGVEEEERDAFEGMEDTERRRLIVGERRRMMELQNAEARKEWNSMLDVQRNAFERDEQSSRDVLTDTCMTQLFAIMTRHTTIVAEYEWRRDHDQSTIQAKRTVELQEAEHRDDIFGDERAGWLMLLRRRQASERVAAELSAIQLEEMEARDTIEHIAFRLSNEKLKEFVEKRREIGRNDGAKFGHFMKEQRQLNAVMLAEDYARQALLQQEATERVRLNAIANRESGTIIDLAVRDPGLTLANSFLSVQHEATFPAFLARRLIHYAMISMYSFFADFTIGLTMIYQDFIRGIFRVEKPLRSKEDAFVRFACSFEYGYHEPLPSSAQLQAEFNEERSRDDGFETDEARMVSSWRHWYESQRLNATERARRAQEWITKSSARTTQNLERQGILSASGNVTAPKMDTHTALVDWEAKSKHRWRTRQAAIVTPAQTIDALGYSPSVERFAHSQGASPAAADQRNSTSLLSLPSPVPSRAVSPQPATTHNTTNQRQHRTPSPNPAKPEPTPHPDAAPFADPKTAADRTDKHIVNEELHWDSNLSRQMMLSPDRRAGRVATAVEDREGAVPTGTAYVLGSVGTSSGVMVWEVEVQLSGSEGRGHTAMVGMASRFYRGIQSPDCPAYFYRSDGQLTCMADGSDGTPFGAPIPEDGQIHSVTVVLDFTIWEMSFFVDGEFQGVAFRFAPLEQPEPLFPVVVLPCRKDGVAIRPPSVDVTEALKKSRA